MKKLIMMAMLLAPTIQSNIFSKPQEQNSKMVKLYIYDYCPYCKNVVNFLKKNNALSSVTVVQVGQDISKDQFKALSGKTQAPFLHDEGNSVKMHESKSIIKYFEKLFDL